MKKILAIAIALVMLCACTFSVSAAQTTLPDSDGNAWWVNHTAGIELTEAGEVITFTCTAYETASTNWHGPLWVLYNGDEAKVNGAGYFEYWTGRGDAWGWALKSSWGIEGDGTFDANSPDLMTQSGISQVAAFSESWGSWDAYQAALKAGTEGKMTVKLEDGKAVIILEIAGVTTTTYMPVNTTKPVYVSLFAEQATLTNIKVGTPDAAPETGDMAGVVIAMMVASGAALVVLKKKEF